MLHLYETGHPYNPRVSSWTECSQYNYRQGGHELILFMGSPTEQEIDALNADHPAEFALYVEGPVIFLLSKFGYENWGDAPYTWWRVPADQRTIPNPEPTSQERAILTAMVVDAETGIIASRIRACTWSPEFTSAIHQAIRKQAKSAYDPATYDKAVDRAYRRHPTTESMLAVAIARCIAGE